MEQNATRYQKGKKQFFLKHEFECLLASYIALLGYGGQSLTAIYRRPQFGTCPFVTEMFSLEDMQMYNASITCYARDEEVVNELLQEENEEGEEDVEEKSKMAE